MEPFRVSAPIAELTDAYVDASTLVSAAKNGGDPARVALARLWLSEGIPFAFKACPAIYESIRDWLSVRLDVHAKEIGLYGSARIGASIAPKKLGKEFGSDSDLDLFVVSADLFDRMKQEFVRWSYDFESNRVSPANAQERSFWQDHVYRGPKNIRRGFIDQKMIPNRIEYPIVKTISQSMWLLVEKLKLTPNAPLPTEAS